MTEQEPEQEPLCEACRHGICSAHQQGEVIDLEFGRSLADLLTPRPVDEPCDDDIDAI